METKVTHSWRLYNTKPVAFYVTLEGKIPRTPIYPTFQFDENVVLYPGIERVTSLLAENGKSVLEFCEFVNDEDHFMRSVKKTSIKNKKKPFSVIEVALNDVVTE